jgi:hypothetical protein
MSGKNRITFCGPTGDGTYVVEFRTAGGEALAISIPRGEAAVIKPLQERMPYELFVRVAERTTDQLPPATGQSHPAPSRVITRCGSFLPRGSPVGLCYRSGRYPSGWRDQMAAFIGCREFITSSAARRFAWPVAARGAGSSTCAAHRHAANAHGR